MLLSDRFDLKKTQYELDFVNIDTDKDIPLFLDPFLISKRTDPVSMEISRTIKIYFQQVVNLINSGSIEEARALFHHLNEPNETCLGLSSDKPRGNGFGKVNEDDVFDSILRSEAVTKGIVENLEDLAIFIEGIGPDKISDMCTQIIRKKLIEYTKTQCNLHDIPLTESVPTGFYWDEDIRNWNQDFDSMLMIDDKKILLIPKYIVSFHSQYVDSQYHQHFVLKYLQGEHLKNNTSLVKVLVRRNGKIDRKVYKKDLKATVAPLQKEFLRQFTENHPEIFQNFKDKKALEVHSMSNEELVSLGVRRIVDYLKGCLTSITLGRESADDYHKLILGALELIFYPQLVHPVKEQPINDGRKRIDISFDNGSTNGFFLNLATVKNIPSRYIFMECKNYSADPENPELDQLSGRFSVNTSQCGFLICRKIDNVALFIQRCKDLWKQKRELVIPLTDEDIFNLLESVANGDTSYVNSFLEDKTREIIL